MYILDKLSNGQIGTVFHIKLDSNQAVTKIYIKFDDDSAGLKRIGTDKFARQNNCIPIERVEAKIRVKTTKLSSPEIKRTQFSSYASMGLYGSQSSRETI